MAKSKKPQSLERLFKLFGESDPNIEKNNSGYIKDKITPDSANEGLNCKDCGPNCSGPQCKDCGPNCNRCYTIGCNQQSSESSENAEEQSSKNKPKP